MTFMLRALILAAIFLIIPRADSGQELSVLHIKVVLVDAGDNATPVPRHRLLVSDNPASAPPREVVTAQDGTADLKLRPGNYTVESDHPVAFHGKAYQWTQMVDIVAGRDTVLELTAKNAEVVPVAPTTTTSGAASEADPSFLLPQWQDSVVGLWTPNTHASGFVIDANGLVATNQRVIGSATTVEVQLTPVTKVAASVLAADTQRDVAVLWIDPKVIASVRPVPLGCAQGVKPTVVEGKEIFTISAPLREQKSMSSGTASRVESHAIMSDIRLATGSEGGPVFTASGAVVGITSVVDDNDQRRHGDVRIVRTDDACEVVAAAEKKMKDAAPPNGTLLPVEPVRPFPVDALKELAGHRAGSLNPYQISSSAFDVAFITPVMIYGVQYLSEQAANRARSKGAHTPDVELTFARPLMDFGNWSEYVADFPPVLLVRVTPKLLEGFWTTVARGAARTQGMSIPPIKHFKSGFSRLRAFCGDSEVTPVHPFKIEQRVSESEVMYEGLYVFEPGAFGPQCETVRFVLYSEKEPDKADTRTVDPGVVQQIWNDFAAYRALTR